MKIKLTSIFAFLLLILSTGAQARFPLNYQSKFNRIVAFGDSLSDQGTYRPYASQMGGGKFTTNPGKLWIELVAQSLGIKISPNRTEGFDSPTELLGGTNYAQGGSRVNGEPPYVLAIILSARSLYEQWDLFASEEGNLNPSDLVFVNSGSNDVIYGMDDYLKEKITERQFKSEILSASKDYVSLVKEMVKNGGEHIYVFNLPAIEQTPRVKVESEKTQAVVKATIDNFNMNLQKGLQVEVESGKVVIIDAYAFDNSFNQHFTEYGFKNITTPACKVKGYLQGNALFCNREDMVEKGAELTYKFADNVHPTEGYSKYIYKNVMNYLVKEFK